MWVNLELWGSDIDPAWVLPRWLAQWVALAIFKCPRYRFLGLHHFHGSEGHLGSGLRQSCLIYWCDDLNLRFLSWWCLLDYLLCGETFHSHLSLVESLGILLLLFLVLQYQMTLVWDIRFSGPDQHAQRVARSLLNARSHLSFSFWIVFWAWTGPPLGLGCSLT